MLGERESEFADVPSADTWVWYVIFSDGGPPLGSESVDVVIDFFDGRVYGLQAWIS
ncbi:MAG TPA: hypothetical protein VFW95_11395 [Candidatus Limnocylindria bacterium]|nr:hypothetical protein [Candidatus Limnocylindria bacterium]